MHPQVLFTVLASLLAAGTCQQQHYDQYEPKRPLPAILSHKQALAHDGSFQYSFAADNGLQQGESIAPDGSRKGAYSYVDPNGKTITVTYTADKNGFHVHGDHLPKPVQPVAAAPQPAYQPQPQYQAAPQNNNYQKQSYDDSEYERPRFGGFGPAVFPPAPARNAAPSFPRPSYNPSHSASSYSPKQQEEEEDYDEKVDPNKPHSFGDGYSFQISG